MKAILFSVFVCVSSHAFADWTLSAEESNLSFVSVKNEVIAETHVFDSFSATIDSKGKIEASVQLDSVNTAIDIRNERLREILFEVESFPEATLSATLEPKFIAKLAIGKPTSLDLPVSISLHGKTQNVVAYLTVVKLSKKAISVSTRSPIMINASQFALADGINKLKEIAGLSSIDLSIPLTGHWYFTK